MVKVTFKNSDEIGGFVFVAEASALGLPPGKWPAAISAEIGNKQQFFCSGQRFEGDELLWVEYKQRFGCLTLHVLND